MPLDTLEARVPKWALEAGLPAPRKGESLVDYAQSIGLDTEELFIELTDRTAELAYYRLEKMLSISLAHAWNAYIEQRCEGFTHRDRPAYAV